MKCSVGTIYHFGTMHDDQEGGTLQSGNHQDFDGNFLELVHICSATAGQEHDVEYGLKDASGVSSNPSFLVSVRLTRFWTPRLLLLVFRAL